MRASMFLIGLFSSSPALAEVTHSAPNGFEIRHVAEVSGTPAEAMARFGQVARWWNPEHSYSGKAENLRLGLKPGDCFCETLPGGGGIEHLRVTYLEPGKRLTLTGGLGPLLFQATAGVMDVQFAASGSGARVTVTYSAAGFAKGGADKIAPAVDQVLGEQMRRFAALR